MNKHALALQGCLLMTLASSQLLAGDRFQVLVQGNTLSWGDNTSGYMQVQHAGAWQTLCEFQVYTRENTPAGNRESTGCEVADGSYNVINHTTRQRLVGILVGQSDAVYTVPTNGSVDGSWTDDEPYQLIDAADVMSDLTPLPTPQELHVQVYSPTAAELFWTPISTPDLHYDVYADDLILGSTQGSSLFLSDLTPGTILQLRVVARDATGAVSSAAQISLVTPGDGSATDNNSADSELQAPVGLSLTVYSDNALELSWDRPDDYQRFQISRNGELLGVTDGNSYFDGNRPLETNTIYEVAAIDDQGRQSAVASIETDTALQPSDPQPTAAAITLANAEQVLREVISIANREPFKQIEAALQLPHEALKALYMDHLSQGVSSADGLTLLPGSSDIVGESAGSDYSCDAGGSAFLSTTVAGEDGQGDVSRFNNCVLPTGTYSGELHLSPATADVDSSYRYKNVQLAATGDPLHHRYDSEQHRLMPHADGVGVQDSWNVTEYTAMAADGSMALAVYDYEASMSTRRGHSLVEPVTPLHDGINYPDATSVITFDADIPSVSTQRLSVDIALNLEGDTTADKPVNQWTDGNITVTAADGSSVTATPIVDDQRNIRILVGDDIVDLPITDALQVEVFVQP